MCMQCRGSLVRLGHYYLVYHRSITCSWLCYAACDATWSEGGLDSPLLSLRAIGSCWMRRMHRMAQLQLMDRSWSEWVGISGGHSPHLQKNSLLLGSFTSLNWLCFCFCTKEDPISMCLSHSPTCELSWIDGLLFRLIPDVIVDAQVTSHHQRGPHVSSCRKLLSGMSYVCIWWATFC